MTFVSMSEAARRAGVHADHVRKLADRGVITRHTVPGFRYPVIRESDVAVIARESPSRYLPPVEINIGVPFTDPTPQQIADRCKAILAKRHAPSDDDRRRCRRIVDTIAMRPGTTKQDLLANVSWHEPAIDRHLDELVTAGVIEQRGQRGYFIAGTAATGGMEPADRILERFRTRAVRHARRQRRRLAVAG
ncbi:hypothetical protein Mal15_38070 [Stieleria maiorica]|uniref:Uncharacterized protein n=1 Tax=Stieleria maiorica TaxID=2795974 RepID=A0A5B9MEQ0_9BACT|nr:hypothetical protein [Stieleria maiorica]QEF99741.1 hypothetical protein Mal15_38070 [Stieleria maiorica]